MSIATLKKELLRELAVAALGDLTHHRSVGAGSELIDWMSGLTDAIRRAWILIDKGPGLIRFHVKHGDRIWFAPGTYPHLCAEPKRVVVTDVVVRTDDAVGVSRICLDLFSGPYALFATAGDVASFLENVLRGHVQDA